MTPIPSTLPPRRALCGAAKSTGARQNFLPLMCAIAWSVFPLGCSTTSSETPIQESQVPAPVLAAFHQQFPATRITTQALEKKGTHSFYELGTDGKGAPHSLIYTPAGELAETEIEIPFAQLPVVVQEAAKRAAPTGKIELAEIAQKKGRTYYEVHFKEGGRTLETMFDPSGNLISRNYE
jgi:Putative beta-lactamase-inhibitor-like, PepSY-like